MDAARYAALFQSEAREHLEELDAALLALERAPAAVETSAHLATLFRGMHTLKGMAAAMGYADVERLSHALESRCEPLRSGAEPLHDAVLALLFEGTDALRAALDVVVLGGGTGPASAATEAFLERLARASAVATIPTVGATPTPRSVTGTYAAIASPEGGTTVSGARVVQVELVPDCPLKGVRAMLVLAKLAARGMVQHTVPPQESWQHDAFDGVFAVTLASDDSDDALDTAARSAGDVSRVRISEATPVRAAAAVVTERTVRIDARRLDTLLDLVGELVITRDRMMRALETMERPDRDMQRAARDTARLVTALQDEVLQTRLLPVAQVFDRFPRLVRDVARELGKEVSFTMEGREIELDRSLLDAIADPILHLLRNALDHGIESPELRLANGKPAAGELVLRAARDRAAVVIQVQDDGRGIDRATVLRRAREQGVVAHDVDTLSDDVLLQVIARPGFSTAQSVTTLSGRGVGVDVVNTRVRALGGQLELETIEGEGTVVTLRLPVTLAITRALLVEVQGTTFAIPAAHVEEALAYHETLRVHHAHGPAVTIRDEVVPLVALRERFGMGASSLETGDAEQHIAVVEAGGRRAALLVDGLVAQQDIVVKPLDMVRGATPWFSGATVLGDGSPALIVDVTSLV
jgi:two-component system chemotaxis sensor kinase CheA